MKTTHVVLVAAVTLAGGLALGLAAPQSRNPPIPEARGGFRWEYGEMIIEDGLATLVTERLIQKIEIPLQPPVDNTIYATGLGPARKQFEPLLYSMNRFGEEGWEIVGDTPPDRGDHFLVRRRR